ncbi:MAG: GNAT family N-acetyltransferase, partial [Nitrosopumilus sp.]|nr:GNAT family N-acetyltransferase [Nitrosopumilus sp.]NNL37269.1 GNAT family N-acetyltransferase [Nitrosopumilus sp.]
MVKLLIRDANSSDKIPILKFCKNTFSWGDYIEHVWNFWLSEGSLFLAQKQNPVGICHAFYSNDQIWIEGIRINPNFRRQNIASKLVKHAEIIGKEKNLSFSFMLIDTENSVSLSMAKSLNYKIFETWNFYSLTPKTNSNFKVGFEKSFNRELYSHYVNSWRWLPIDDQTLESLYLENRIIKSSISGQNSFAILNSSKHFEKTLIVTLFSNSNDSVLEILSFLQNYSIENNYERIQI